MWFDAPSWVHQQLTTAFPTWRVTPEIDPKVTAFPALVWALSVSNPDDRGLWAANLTLTLLCTPAEAEGLCEQLHNQVQAWQTPGPVNSVTLQSFTPDRGADTKTIHHYLFVYSLTWDL